MKRSLVDFVNVLGFIIVLALVIFAGYTLFIGSPFYEGSDFTIGLKLDDEDKLVGVGSESGSWTSDGTIDDVDVGNVSGRIEIEGWNNEYAEIEYIKRGPGKHPEVKIDQNGRKLTVKAVYPRPASNFGSVDFILKVPENLSELKAGSVSGRINVTGMGSTTYQKLSSTSGSVSTDGAGTLDISSVSGRIEFSASGERINASTTSGGISGRLEKTDLNGRIKMNSVSGRLRLELPSDTEADVDLHSVSGAVSTEMPVSVTETKRNSIKGKIGNGGTSIEMSTVSGSVKLTE